MKDRYPLIQKLVQQPEQPTIEDPAGAVRAELQRAGIPERIRPGHRIAIAVGSRGISNLVPMVQAVIETVREAGGEPFIVAAMGSHGGATPEGQRELLADYGISEAVLGVPVKTDMETECIGRNEYGLPVFWDRNALNSDGVITVSRVKPHTDFRGRYESGVVKMLVIGLGKRDGAETVHRLGSRGLRIMLPASARVILERTPFLAGVAIVENFYDKTAVVRVLTRDNLLEEEPALLELARELMAKLPFGELDVLIVGELGKNYSGAGMDPNVIGRMFIAGEPEFDRPRISRIAVLDVSPESHGNATGVGLADFTTDRLVNGIDPLPFRVNAMVSTFVERARIPLSFPTDRQVLDALLDTCWQPDLEKVRLAIIPNTLELVELWATPAACEEGLPDYVRVVSEPTPIPFDSSDNLIQETLFPHSWRARRMAGATGASKGT